MIRQGAVRRAERGCIGSSRYWYLVGEVEGRLAGLIAFRDRTHSAVPVYRRFGFEQTAAVVQKHGISFVPMKRGGGAV